MNWLKLALISTVFPNRLDSAYNYCYECVTDYKTDIIESKLEHYVVRHAIPNWKYALTSCQDPFEYNAVVPVYKCITRGYASRTAINFLARGCKDRVLNFGAEAALIDKEIQCFSFDHSAIGQRYQIKGQLCTCEGQLCNNAIWKSFSSRCSTTIMVVLICVRLTKQFMP